jgi:DNA-binding response OmpR family regulator
MIQAKSILLVDDEPGLRQLLMTTLASPDFAIAQAGSGAQALELARQLRPDLIVLDVGLMPEHPNGIEVCAAIKHDPTLTRSRILMLTAATRPEDRQAAQAAGADYYLTKPFSPRALLDYIYHALLD